MIAAMLGVMALMVELIYRLEWVKNAPYSLTTTIVNWAVFALMFGLCFAVRRLTFTTWFICPILTAFTYYHFAFVDYDGTATSIYFASIIGMGLSYFILVMTSEVWLFSSLVYVPLFVYYLYKTSGSLVEV